ncbi:MAG: F0F1 ATP synthase subunit delta [Rhodospirillales bacterium]|nr:F0F1 ATP synthase subunit delta [Rhodospirillales bacterium]
MVTETSGASGLAARYAAALFDLAEPEGALDRVAQDLAQLRQMIRESKDLGRVIRSPIISRDNQKNAVLAVLDKAGVHDLTRRFVSVVTANRRLFALPDMIAAYLARLAHHRGEVTADVRSAVPLNDAQLDALRESLKRALGAKVAVDASVDANLLGGLVVKIGSRMVDSSLSTKLERLRFAMKGVG